MVETRPLDIFINKRMFSVFRYSNIIHKKHCSPNRSRGQSYATFKRSSPAATLEGGGSGKTGVDIVNNSPLHLNDIVTNKSGRTVENVTALAVTVVVAAVGLYALDTNPWEAYEVAVKMNPIETKACISGIVYSFGDLIAQNYEGRDVSEWDRGRVLRSGLCGLLAHGPLSHLYYLGLDTAFAQQSFIDVDSWMSPIIKVGIDQTVWSIFWNSTYYVLLGILKAESPQTIVSSVRQSWWDLLKAGWRLWPIVHVCTYGIIPVQHRLLFVDTVELIWVCILSTYGQQQRQVREVLLDSPSRVTCPLPGQSGEGGDFAEEILRGLAGENEIIFETTDGGKVVKSAQEVYSADSHSS